MTDVLNADPIFDVDSSLCVYGNPEQVDAHRLVDNMPKAEARHLDEDSAVVVEAGRVCAGCTNLEYCGTTVDLATPTEVVEGAVEMPRGINFAGVVGSRLVLNLGVNNRSVGVIDVEDDKGRAERTVMFNDAQAMHDRLSSFTAGLTDDQRLVYDIICGDELPKDYVSSLQDLVARRQADLPKKVKLQNQKGKEVTVSIPGELTTALNEVMRGILLVSGYGQDLTKSRRYELLAKIIDGELPISKLTGNADDDITPEMRIALSKKQILQADVDSLHERGACIEIPNYRDKPTRSERPAPYRRQCLNCPLFAVCGFVTLVDAPPTKIGATLKGLDIQDTRRVFDPKRLKAIKSGEDPDFDNSRSKIIDAFKVFRRVLTPTHISNTSAKGSDGKSYAEHVTELQQKLTEAFEVTSR